MKNKALTCTIITYVILIGVQMFLFLPYNVVEIFVTEQYVPHETVIGSGYSTIFDIATNTAELPSRVNHSSKTGLIERKTGKVINVSQLLINLTFITLGAGAFYLPLYAKYKSELKQKEK